MFDIEKLRAVRETVAPSAATPNCDQRTAQLIIEIIDSHIEAHYEISDLRTRLFHEWSGGSGEVERW